MEKKKRNWKAGIERERYRQQIARDTGAHIDTARFSEYLNAPLIAAIHKGEKWKWMEVEFKTSQTQIARLKRKYVTC